MDNGNIPKHADKYIFAGDIVNHVFRHNNRISLGTPFGRFREFVYNGFNDKIKTAVEFIESFAKKQALTDFERMSQVNVVNETGYVKYAETIQKVWFSEGFDAEQFLYYCVRLSYLAEYFYDVGVFTAPTSAVLSIVDAFSDYDMFNGGWKALEIVAKRIASVSADVEELWTPPTTPSELSEDENFADPL